MTPSNGSGQGLTILQQIHAGIAGITEADLRAPKRSPKKGDTIVGVAPFHIKALFSFAQQLADPLNEEAMPWVAAADAAKIAATDAGVSSRDEFDDFLAKNLDMKAAVDKVEELRKKYEKMRGIFSTLETLLSAELSAAFPDVDQRHKLKLDSDWNVVYPAGPTGLGGLVAALAASGVQVIQL